MHKWCNRCQVLPNIFFFCAFAVLEVHQFAQEAVVAEAWLTAQEPLLSSNELGGSVDEVEQLIRRHEAFRKAATTWEERFSSLRRLTTVRETSQPNPRVRGIQSCSWRCPSVLQSLVRPAHLRGSFELFWRLWLAGSSFFFILIGAQLCRIVALEEHDLNTPEQH